MTSPWNWKSEDRPSVILADADLRATVNRSAGASRRVTQDRQDGRPIDIAYGRNYKHKSAKPEAGDKK